MRSSRLHTLLLATLLAFFSVTSRNTIASDRPNVLVILVDDLGYGDLSCYGAEDMRTPHMDQLMQRGVRLNEFYANCPVCSPTRASLLSGRYPDRVGVPGVIRTHAGDNWGFLDPSAILLSELFQRNEYHTALVGKWHLGLESPNTPTERGFDTFHGFLGDMMDDYYHHQRHGHHYMRKNKEVIHPKGHATDLFAQWANSFLLEQALQEEPFLLYLAFNAPHTPIQPPKSWLHRVKAREDGISHKRASLVALIEHLDAAIGSVLQTLDRTKLSENTIVAFASDNGGQLNVGARCGPLRGGKQDMYEGGIKVPACVLWPSRISPGQTSNQRLLTMDLYPTLCEAADIEISHTIEGVSFLPMLLGKEQEWPQRDLVWMRREGNMRYQGRDYYALRRGPWKLVQNSPFMPYELYHLEKDPMEATNQAHKETKVYRELVRALQYHVQQGGKVAWQSPR